jgi:threonine/homoserine/homoserine lactone efflux protein
MSTGGTPVFDTPTLLSYLVAALLLAIAPGPGQLLVLARTVAGGRSVGVATALGLAIGYLVHTVAAALGLSALLARSTVVFAVLQYLGAAYLIWLGVKAFRTENAASALQPVARGLGFPAAVARGAVTGILNPKVALFFLAFLPQFVRPERGQVLVQFLVLGLIFSLLAFLGDTTVVLAASRATKAVRQSDAFSVWRERAVGAVLIGLGVRLAVSRRA